MATKVRLKAQFANELRSLSVAPDVTYEAFMGQLAMDYGTKVILCYVDDEGDTITVRSQYELRTALEEFVRKQAGGKQQAFKVVLKPDCNDSAAEDILKQQRRLHAQITTVVGVILDASEKIEPVITRVLQRLALMEKGSMAHLDHRIKTRTSLTRKMFTAARTSKDTVDMIAKNIKDALRYTVLLDTENYTKGMQSMIASLEGYREAADGIEVCLESAQIKNFWVVESGEAPPQHSGLSAEVLQAVREMDSSLMSVRLSKAGTIVTSMPREALYTKDRTKVRKGDEYQGVNSVWRDRNSGLMWELQFHTPESLEVKEASHRVYERYRLETDPVAMRDMYEQMVEMWDSVPRPENVETVGTGVGVQAAPELPAIPPDRQKEFDEAQRKKSEALVAARTVLNNWVEARTEAIVTALINYLAVKYDAMLHNIQGRLLGKYQIRWEITKLVATGCSMAEAAARITDSLKYTLVIGETDYAIVVQRCLTDLQRNGMVLMQLHNEWSHGRGVNCVLQTENGRLYTVSFHTASSREKASARRLAHGEEGAGEEEAAAAHSADGSAALAAELKRQQKEMDAAYLQTVVPEGALALSLAACTARVP